MNSPARPSALHLFAAAGLAAACVVAAAPADVVILKDGFVIQGEVRKEHEAVKDPATGARMSITAASGFDLIDEGPKVWVFSSHQKQLGEISKDTKIRPTYRAFKRDPYRKSDHSLPAGAFRNVTDFNDKWVRTMEVVVPNGHEKIEQMITYLDPYFCYIFSTTHLWRLCIRTSEMDPYKVRRLLYVHPEIAEPDGKCDPLKRLSVARFMLDAGWIPLAKEELDRLKKDHPGELPKDAKEIQEKLLKDIDRTTAELVANEAELALGAGRYAYAAELLAAFPDKTADPKDVDRATRLMAQAKTTRERYDAGRKYLRRVIDQVTGYGSVSPFLAVAGGVGVSVVKPAGVNTQTAALAAAAEVVYAELHPDSADRIEFFVNLATDAERQREAGQPPGKKPEELLATAISGWAKGKNGATPVPDTALRVWNAREMVLAYQRSPDLNTRNTVLAAYKRTGMLGLDELAQIISLLPPAVPEDLANRTGTPVRAGNGVPPGVYKRTSERTPERGKGIDYFVRLPPEYHHGRAYPVLLCLTHPLQDADKMLGSLAAEADRHGYILAAPDWANFFGKGWQWSGDDHVYVTAVLRDLVRHFTVDNDRVFMVGAGDGANMAMDVGMSHPDLFAGVLPMGPIPKWQNMFLQYWPNAQKLPFYVVTGDMSGPSIQNLRLVYEKWMPRGFPAVMVVYKGRGVEWYGAEPPVMFDWMNRKKRANGTSTLQVAAGERVYWQTMRASDNRFYWLGADKVDPRYSVENQAGKAATSAQLGGNILGNNLIDLRTRGVRTVSVWLGRDMIDWSKPVSVNLNGRRPDGWKNRVLEPDLNVLLEDYRERGDRRMLYLARLEFEAKD